MMACRQPWRALTRTSHELKNALEKVGRHSVGEYIGDRLARLGDSRRIIFPQKGRQGGGNLILCDRGNFGTLAESGCVWTKKSHPDVLGVGDFGAMVAPFMRSFSPAMVGRKNKRGIAAVLRHGLHQFPKSPQVGIDAVGRIQV